MCYKNLVISGLCICLLAPLTAPGQPVKLRIVDLQLNKNQPPVRTIAQDEDGFIWTGDNNGLMTFDGTTFTPVTAQDEKGNPEFFFDVYALKASRKRPEILWIGTLQNGLIELNRHNRRVRHFKSLDQNGQLGGKYAAHILEDDDGTLWIGTDNLSITRMHADGTNIQVFRPELPAGASEDEAAGLVMAEIVPDLHQPDYLWAATRLGLYHFHKPTGRFEFFPFAAPLPFFYSEKPLPVYAAPDGRVWTGGPYSSLLCLDPATRKWQTIAKISKTTDDLLTQSILQIIPEKDDWLFIRTEWDVFWWYHPPTGRQELLNQEGSKRITNSRNVFPFPDPGNPGLRRYIVTSDYGMMLATNYDPMLFFVPYAYLNPAIKKYNWQRAYCLSPDKKTLYIGTMHGLGLLAFQYRENKIAAYSYAIRPKLDSTDIWMDDLCFDDDGRLWIGSDLGLLYFDTLQHKIFPYASSPGNEAVTKGHHIYSVVAKGDWLWLGEKKGIFLLNRKTGAVRPLFPEDPARQAFTRTVTKIFADRNHYMWLIGSNGIMVVDDAGRPVPDFAGYEQSTVWKSNVSDVLQDKSGHIWFSSPGQGLFRIRMSGKSPVAIDSFHCTDRASANVIYCIVEGYDGRIWTGTTFGHSAFDPQSGKFVNYDKRDGLFMKQYMFALPDSSILSSGKGGYHRFYPEKMLKESQPPVPYLKNFKIFDQTLPQYLNIENQEDVTLSHDKNHFSFEFGALNFEENARNNFAYQLEGYDQSWVYCGDRDYASYTNLPKGTYRFRVKVANKHGLWSLRDKFITVHILPPFWQSWWFMLLAMVLLAALVFQYRKRWQREQNKRESQKIIEYFANSTYSSASVDEILWDMTRNCISRLNLEDCVVYLLDKERNVLVQKTAFGKKNFENRAVLNPIEIPLGSGIVGTVAITGVTEIVNDTSKDPRYIVDDATRLSEIAVPIAHLGQVIGVIDSEHPQRRFFKEEHRETLNAVAAVCADKIAKAITDDEIRVKEKQLLELDQKLTESELTALKAQMNPHFMFNALNSINWYIIKNRPMEASKYLTKFSRLIRLILDNSKYSRIALADELEALRLYIDLEAIRFEQKFDYQIITDKKLDLRELKIAPMILQPFVENSIWHGLMQSPRPGTLTVNVQRNGKHLFCTIEDNGIGRAAAQRLREQSVGNRESKGMRITTERIAMLNQSTDGGLFVRVSDLSDASGTPSGTRVEITLPLEYDHLPNT